MTNSDSKVAIITGASRGIGACLAEGLAADGFSLALVARSNDDLAKIAQRAKSAQIGKAQLLFCPFDISNETALRDFADRVHTSFGRVDLLINNAGLGCLGTLHLSLEEFDKVMAVNLRACFVLMQKVVPIMEKQKKGTIINIASTAGKIGFAEYGAYAASKFGLVGLSQSLCRELAPQGIKVTTLCPSWVDTDMAAYSDLPAEEMIAPNDILKSIRWILSLSAAAVVPELTIECRKQVY